MPPRILIADDTALVRAALRHLLEGIDHYEILEAEDGYDAVQQALDFHPNLAILDLAMPRMDGLTAAGKISQAHPELPILMYTMHFSRHIEVEALKHGVRKVISKTDSAALVSSVRELLASQKASPQTGVSALLPVNLLDSPTVDSSEPAQIRPDQPEPAASPAAIVDPIDPTDPKPS
jgi:DNA-binding NarL/FixJ family response regulator